MIGGITMKIAVFDLDGTLADTLADLADAVNYGLRKMNCPEHTLEQYRYMVGNGAKKLCYRALPEDRKSEEPELLDLFREYYSAHLLDNTCLYGGMRETLHTLAENGVKLAVATNKPEDAARELVAELLPEVDFVRVMGGNSRRPVKPDTQVIAEIFAALPDEPAEAYMIGDSNVDVQTGKNAGIKTIGCAWGFRGRAELEAAGADFVAEEPADILRFIL